MIKAQANESEAICEHCEQPVPAARGVRLTIAGQSVKQNHFLCPFCASTAHAQIMAVLDALRAREVA